MYHIALSHAGTGLQTTFLQTTLEIKSIINFLTF